MSFTLMGGPVFAQNDFFSFHYEWDRIAECHNVQLPIHMKEFARPHGRLAYLTDSQRRALFHELVFLINRNKLYSLTVAVDNLQFHKYFPQPVFHGYMGPAPLAFLWCLVFNCVIVRKHETLDPMAYLVARSDVNSQLVDCHDFWCSHEKQIGKNTRQCTGSFTIDTPTKVNALQAADLIAWANLKKHRGQTFSRGFEPLELLTRYVDSNVKPGIHLHFQVNEKNTKGLAAILGTPTRRKGRRISLLPRAPEIREAINQINVQLGK